MIQVRERHLPSVEVLDQVRERVGREELTDAAAVTIASWYQAPRGTGSVLATFASGLPVNREDLSRDVSDTIDECYDRLGNLDRRALDMLGTWVLHRCEWCGGPGARLNRHHNGELFRICITCYGF